MARAHSFVITYKNLKTENEGLKYVLQKDKRFIPIIDKHMRKEIIKAFKIDKKYAKAFDAILLKKMTSAKKVKISPATATLIEFKTTKEKLMNNPKGFFFGATKNEFDLAKELGDKFRFCFVCLHPQAKSFMLLTFTQLKKMIRRKRIQYQVDL